MQAFRKLLILSHRYIGIPLSFMFVLWFFSAFFMIYTGGMPRITPEMRIEAAPALDFAAVALTPAEAAERAGFLDGSVRLRSLLGRPAYEFDEPGFGTTLVYADNGEVAGPLDEEQARRVAGDFLGRPASDFRYQETLGRVDQWSLTQSADLPLFKFVADDEYGTEVYVSRDKGAVSVYTTGQSRLLAWLGTIPHWLYFSSLRLDQPLWYAIVVWSSAIGCVLALLGLCLGVVQLRKTRPFSLSRAIPYRGAMRWHYILGSVFGLVTLTWVFSGLLSMEPFAWARSGGLELDRRVYREGQLDLDAFPRFEAARWDALEGEAEIKEVEFSWIQERPYLLASYSAGAALREAKRDRLHQPYQILGQAEADSLLVDARSLRPLESFDIPTLVEKLDAAAADAAVLDYTLMERYDDYYYSRNAQLPLPVLRVRFDDPGESWVYVDPHRSQVLSVIDDYSRVERWLYNGLHSLDFAFWYHRRPLWDIGVILLLAGGLATSCLGLWFGLRRLGRDIRALTARLRGLRLARPERSTAANN